MTSIIIRCEKCGKVLKGKVQKSNIVVKCPRCNDNFVVPDPITRENRKNKRIVIPESKHFRTLPDSIIKSNNPATYKVVYTEAPPVEFALKRSDRVPLLDISESGMSFIIRVDESSKVLPGDILVLEIDFPVFTQPVYTKVEVCWIRSMKEEKLMHVGVRFYQPTEALKKVLNGMIKYIAATTKSLDFETWGSI
jgi:phage FluMu protein Com